MPLCPQVTITPVTVTTSGMTSTSVIDAGVPATTGQLDETAIEAAAAVAAAAAAQADADAAQADAATAISSANAAISTANTAYSTAVAANTAAGVAQSTADGKNKVTYSTAAPGSTANAVGDIWYQYGTTSPNVGRIIAQYSGAGGTSWTQTTISGLVVANIDAGNITTGTLTAAVGISNPSGNFSVNGATGALVCTGATVTGTIVATTGTFTGTVFASSGTFTGTVTATTGSFTGQVFATGGTFTGNVTTNANIQTSSGTSSVRLSGSSNSLTFVTSGSAVGHIVPLTSFGVLTHYGATADPTGGTFPQMFVGSSNVSLFANTSNGIGVSTSTGIQMTGSVNINNTLTYDGAATASGSTLVLVTTGRRVGYVSSSRTTKKNIEPLSSVGFVDKLLTLEPVGFDWKDQPEDMPYRRNYGLIAEDVAALGNEMESIVNYNAEGLPVSISYDRLSTFLISAVKELKAEIEQLKGA